MKIETLKERISKAEEKIVKKQGTIEKKAALILKKTNSLASIANEQDKHWVENDIHWLNEDIKRLGKEIEETKATLAKYNKQLAGEMEKEEMFLREIPESMKALQDELVTRWDEYDIKLRDQIRADRKAMDYKEYCKKYSVSARQDFVYKTDEQLHDANMSTAKAYILDLYYRVKAITGEVTDWSGVRACGACLNGFVVGKEGRAEVESILAGGYNIQRLHVRVLVHDRH